ncbi:hypothetical protein N7603_07740 [Acholeplasma vituli]|uniref:Uncharacterized protein n=1 Tax=Paracholeplasma vituli TaxID=69473 RepID=A0ABT2PX67_9MOLU|nr:hypothetical protein [Paracholeplasma vituli]MCU0105549.1 hypothetical protein [Paracholeplasma vituli]
MSKAYDQIHKLGDALKKDPNVLCLLGLGSMSETTRVDDYSDMDFFLIVETGLKQHYIDHLEWLTIEPIVFIFKNTEDGYKVLFKSGVFAEFAVFEKEELPSISFTTGQVIYKHRDFDLSWIIPKNVPSPKYRSIEYLVNEALSNLYIGLKRDLRGEKASAFSFIQVYAASLIAELLPRVYKDHVILTDPFVFERRIEFRILEAASILSEIKQGYNQNKASAKAALLFLETHFEVNKAMSDEINHMIEFL